MGLAVVVIVVEGGRGKTGWVEIRVGEGGVDI